MNNVVEPVDKQYPQNTKQERIHRELINKGEALTEIFDVKHKFQERLEEQIAAIQKKIGSNPINHPNMQHWDETKIRPHGLKFTFGQRATGGWFSKINYVGTDFKNDPYIKAFVVKQGRYAKISVKHLDIFDMAKIIDYLKLTYNV